MSSNDLKTIFSNNLIKCLNYSNKSQRELAEYLQLDETTIGKWTLKKTLPRMGTIEKIANFFGVKKSDLLEDKKNIEDIKTDQKIQTIAAHFEGKKITEDDVKKILDYADYIINKKD